ncbi:MAG: D-2-hydroxyacid dehydrogenase [Saprospiraceae bacterium]|nr:D-2-hydroxyacid dehydrogenase [Saprospiraceae bacterium]
MIRILANDGIHASGKTQLEDAGYEVVTDKIPQEELPEKLPAFDVVIVRSATKIRKDLIDVCPKLKVIARGGVGMDNIDVDYARSKGLAVVNTPAASSRSVAELAFGHMLSLTRFLHLSNREMPSKGASEFKTLKKNFAGGSELHGKTLGILGFGRIGQETARIALGMGMKVLPVDLYVKEATIDIKIFELDHSSISVKLDTVDMAHMLKNSDYISTHVPFSGDKALVGSEEIEMMKDGVILVNTARGGIIGEDALLAGLESGKIRAVGLDVFDNEPTPNATLLNHPKISVSPHIGAATGEAQANIGKELADQIIDHLGS